MENYHYASSYPDSGDSSPRSREIECENAMAWDEPPPSSAVRVKLMCSYAGRIQPRAHDNQLSYVGGETKILAVDRTIRFPAILSKLSSLSGAASPDDVCLKYQLPGEDLDALISVTNDEDLEHMMLEYDRLHRLAGKPAARLRLFLFPVSSSMGKSDRFWFVDALNSVPVQPAPPLEAAPPVPSVVAATAPATESPDFLFGLDKGFVPPSAVKVKDLTPESGVLEPFPVEARGRSDLGKEDLPIGGETVVSPAEMQKHIQELQRLQIAENPQQMSMQRNGSEETLTRVFPGDYYVPRVQETAPPVPPPASTQVPMGYWQDQRSMTSGRYTSMAGDQQFYLIPANTGVYPQAGQGYYTAMQRMVPPEVYREAAAVYAMAPPTPQQQQQQQAKVVGQYQDGAGVVRSQQGVDVSTTGFAAQVAYDSTGRALYYTGAMPTYQTVPSPALNPEGNKVSKPSPVS